jgi:hypothetical protein
MSRSSRNSRKFEQDVEIKEENINEFVIETPFEVVINKIKRKGEWVVTEDFENTVKDMLAKGLIFEIRPNVVKLLE